MRTEKEMLDLIINTAKEEERIRAVLMVGSRADSNAPKDIYQDYDICYYVKDVTPFYNNMEWIEEKFGKPAIMQLPEVMTHPALPPIGDGHFTYLMIFEDGNRIDLSIDFNPHIDEGEPAIVLLDKDGMFLKINPSENYWNIKPPKEEIYFDTCNEFWWCLNNVAKGIARDELSYTMDMFHKYVRDILNQMLEWHIGMKTDFSVSAGKQGKYFKNYLSQEMYSEYKKTYSDSEYDNIWNSVFTACNLFRKAAIEVADFFHYTYNKLEDDNMICYLEKVRRNELL